MALADEKYLLLTTFRCDGRPVAAPVWVVGLDGGEIGFGTSSTSGKVKRLAHTSRVTVQPCDMRGRVKEGTAPAEATARVVSGAEVEVIRSRVRAKYGVMVPISKALGVLGGLLKRRRQPYSDRGVIITPAS